MTTRARTVVFFAFVMVFAIAGVSILLYAHGYRYHWKRGVLEKTGQIIIETEPKGAEVLLNGRHPRSAWRSVAGVKTRGATTPLRIEHLLSGVYEVHVSKEGYFPWQQSIAVLPGRATLRTDIVLLPKQFNTHTITFEDASLRAHIPLFDGQHEFYIAAGDTVYKADVRSSAPNILYKATAQIAGIDLSPSKKFLLVRSGETGSIVDIFKGARVYDFPLLGSSFTWDSVRDLLVGHDEHSLLIVDPHTRTARRIAAIGVVSVKSDDARAYSLFRNDLGVMRVIDVFNPKASIKRVALLRPARSVDYAASNRAVLGDEKRRTFLVDVRAGKIQRDLGENGRVLPVSPDTFLSWNEFEVVLYPGVGSLSGATQSVLVTRVSTPIASVAVTRSGRFVATLRTDGSLKIYEVRATGTENVYDFLAPSTEARSIWIGDDGRTLMIVQAEKGSIRVFQIPMEG